MVCKMNSMTDKIPQQLKNSEFRFIKIAKNAKIAIEKKWQEHDGKNYPFDNGELLNWIAEGGNYGIIAGYHNLVIIDSDTEKIKDLVAEWLPETFTVKSPGHNGCLLYTSPSPRD